MTRSPLGPPNFNLGPRTAQLQLGTRRSGALRARGRVCRHRLASHWRHTRRVLLLPPPMVLLLRLCITRARLLLITPLLSSIVSTRCSLLPPLRYRRGRLASRTHHTRGRPTRSRSQAVPRCRGGVRTKPLTQSRRQPWLLWPRGERRAERSRQQELCSSNSRSPSTPLLG